MYTTSVQTPTLATRFARNTFVVRSETPLAEDQMRRAAPSIFAQGKHASRSERYTYIPSIDVLRGLRKEGFEPFMVAQGNTVDQLTEARRVEDTGRSLWLAMNRVQSNIMQGGQPGRTARGRRMHTRAVGSIDRTVTLNRALWVLAEEMRKLKTYA